MKATYDLDGHDGELFLAPVFPGGVSIGRLPILRCDLDFRDPDVPELPTRPRPMM